MMRFFQSAKRIASSYIDPISYGLLEILRPDGNWDGNKNAATEFYEAHKDSPINIYFSKEYAGHNRSIIRMCLISEPELLIKILHSHPMQEVKYHDWKEVFDCLCAASDPRLQQELINFYKSRLPKVLIENIDAFVTPTQSNTDAFRKHFENFPSQDIWRLFIDAKKQRSENGWLDYETREPGFMKGMLNGLKHLESTIHQILTVNLLKELHMACSSNVQELENNHVAGSFRNNSPIYFQIGYSINASLEGLIELMESMDTSKTSHSVTEGKVMLSGEVSADMIESKLEAIVKKYNEAILLQKDNESRLRCIVKLVSDLERAHPFGDANCRTFCVLLLNRELMLHGFSPVILEDPNRFDGYSCSELCNEVISGMQKFQEVKAGYINNLGIANEAILELIHNDSRYSNFIHTQELLTSTIKPSPLGLNK